MPRLKGDAGDAEVSGAFETWHAMSLLCCYANFLIKIFILTMFLTFVINFAIRELKRKRALLRSNSSGINSLPLYVKRRGSVLRPVLFFKPFTVMAVMPNKT